MKSRITIATFGEVLWDILPRGIFLGGAPFNVAYHLSRQGVDALPISAVGKDFLGREAMHRVTGWKLDTRHIAQLGKPTGTVRATLNASGAASYVFADNVAWDHVPVTPALLNEKAPAALVFGTLALRGKSNRRSLTTLCKAWPHTLRVLDINLRPPFDKKDAIDFALKFAQVVKLNDEELARLTEKKTNTSAQIKNAAMAFAKKHRVDRICVTAGARGAGLWWDKKWHWETGRVVRVRDTVGAGDSFLGALLAALLQRHETPATALAKACRLGEFIAARDGATPPYQIDSRGNPSDK